MSMVDVGNWAVFLIYFAILFKSIFLFLDIHKASLYGYIELVVYAFSFTLTLQSATFIILQIEWILEANNDAISDVASWGWMFYDYFNGFSLLSFVIALEIYIGWRIPNSRHNRRREDKI